MVEAIFIEAAKSRRLCELVDAAGHARTVEPHMVFTSSKGKRLLHCYQARGYSEGQHHFGWKNLEVGAFQSAQILDRKFAARADYNPFDSSKFPTVHFAISPRDERQG
jgi:hypothetical protein